MPRILIVHDTVVVDDPALAMTLLTHRDLNLAETVVIEQKGTIPPPEPKPGSGSTAAILYQDPQRIDVAVTALADGYLILR